MAVRDSAHKRRRVLLFVGAVILVCIVIFGVFYLLKFRELDQALDACLKGIRISAIDVISTSQDSNRTGLNITIAFENRSDFSLNITEMTITFSLDQQLIATLPPLQSFEVPPHRTSDFSMIIHVYAMGVYGRRVSGSGTVEGCGSYWFMSVSKTKQVSFDKVIE